MHPSSKGDFQNPNKGTLRGITMADFDQELDASGLNCPLPILRAKKAIAGLESGQVLRIIATDPGSVKDFEAFAKKTAATGIWNQSVSTTL